MSSFDKPNYDRTPSDVVRELEDIIRVHGQHITGVIVSIKYDNHLEPDDLAAKENILAHSYLCAGLTLVESLGALEYAKLLVYEENKYKDES